MLDIDNINKKWNNYINFFSNTKILKKINNYEMNKLKLLSILNMIFFYSKIDKYLDINLIKLGNDIKFKKIYILSLITINNKYKVFNILIKDNLIKFNWNINKKPIDIYKKYYENILDIILKDKYISKYFYTNIKELNFYINKNIINYNSIYNIIINIFNLNDKLIIDYYKIINKTNNIKYFYDSIIYLLFKNKILYIKDNYLSYNSFRIDNNYIIEFILNLKQFLNLKNINNNFLNFLNNNIQNKNFKFNQSYLLYNNILIDYNNLYVYDKFLNKTID